MKCIHYDEDETVNPLNFKHVTHFLLFVVVLISQLRAVPQSCEDQPGCAKKKNLLLPRPRCTNRNLVWRYEVVRRISLNCEPPANQTARINIFQAATLSHHSCPFSVFLINSSALPGLFKNCHWCYVSPAAEREGSYRAQFPQSQAVVSLYRTLSVSCVCLLPVPRRISPVGSYRESVPLPWLLLSHILYPCRWGIPW